MKLGQETTLGKQGLLSSIQKLAETGFGVRPRRRTIITAMAVLVLLPIEPGHAGWLSDVFKGSARKNSAKAEKPIKRAAAPKRAAPAKPAATPKTRNVRLAALGPINLNLADLKPACDPSRFRIVVDVGHTAESEGAMSARNVSEFSYNLRLARRIEERLKTEGFSETRLLLTEGKARRSLVRRVEAANSWSANLFLSIHHDSVPDKFLEEWEHEGSKRYFSDRFSGHSVFVSRDNPDFKTSLRFAELLATEMKAQGLEYARQYSQPIMGRYRRPLLNKETGVYRYDELVVLKKTRMPAVLLEAGSIINRDEELKMDSAERRDIISSGVAAAARQFCDFRWGVLGPI